MEVSTKLCEKELYMNNKIKLMIISLMVSSMVIGANSDKKVNTNVSASQKDIQNNGKDSEKNRSKWKDL